MVAAKVGGLAAVEYEVMAAASAMVVKVQEQRVPEAVVGLAQGWAQLKVAQEAASMEEPAARTALQVPVAMAPADQAMAVEVGLVQGSVRVAKLEVVSTAEAGTAAIRWVAVAMAPAA